MLNHKYDFVALINVHNANPNGDPLNGNRPRINYNGIGEISDVCIKRKIRNRLLDMGKNIFVQSDDYQTDDYTSLRARAENTLSKDVLKDEIKLRNESCKTWIDVRAFGQLFAFKGGEAKGVSVGIRGPVSIQSAYSLDPVNITSIQITKSVNSEGEAKTKSSDTMGMKHRIDYGLYKFAGSINPQLASRTGFDDVDAEDIKQAILKLFENDASSARPEGSMELAKLFWWKHNSQSGQYSAAKVHRSVKVVLKADVTEAKCIEDYDISIDTLDGLECMVYDGQ